MHELRTLGPVDLMTPGGTSVRAILAQPKRLALVAYLALARPRGYHRRDALLAIFWPELDQSHARGALSRAVHFIRRALGDTALVSRGDGELGVSQAALQCDATRFEGLLDTGELEEALALYQGDLLQGFFISGAPEFERWLEDERKRLRDRAAAAAWLVAEREETHGNLSPAAHWARRAAALAPYDEAALRRLVGVLARSGNGSAAVLAYESFVQRLKDDLDVEPSGATTALVAEIRRRDGHTPRPVPTETVTRAVPRAPLIEARSGMHKRRANARGLTAMAGAGLLLTGALATLAVERKVPRPPLNPDAVVVLPFRVSGSPSLAYLGEGVVDLLAAKLNGEGGPRAVDPQAVMSAWSRAARRGAVSEQEALALARRLHAGKVITGSVVGTGNRVALDAFLLDVGRGTHRATATVDGSPDSILTLIDRMTAQLLARGAGEEEHLASLTSTSLAALRPYLAGQAAYRSGAYREASRDFQRALLVDSTFALAAVGLQAAQNWTGELTPFDALAAAILAAHRDRLSQRDRALISGTWWNHTLSEALANGERAVTLAPDRPEAWYRVAELRFHVGSLLGAPLRAAHARAALEFAKAVGLDSGYAPALSHLVEYAAEMRDGSAARRFGTLYLAVDSSGDIADYVRWLVAVTRHDGLELRRLRSGMPRTDTWNLLHLVGDGQLEGIGLDDVDSAAATLAGRAGSREDLWQLFSALHNLALNRGRPKLALAWSRSQREFELVPGETDRRIVLDALLGGGDSTAAREAAERLASRAAAPVAARTSAAGAQYRDVCVLGFWRLAHRDTAAARVAIARLRYPRGPVWRPNEVCTTTLDAALASSTGRPDGVAALAQLDSLLLIGPTWSDFGYSFGIGSWGILNLVSAGLHEAQGDLAGALAAARRRAYDWSSPVYLASFLREEGRLASLTGEREGALHAYQHYLALRANPEREAQPEVDRVRAAVATLARDRP